MPISPWVVGQENRPWEIQIIKDDGRYLDLTGVTVGQLSLRIYNSARQFIGVGAGTFTITNIQGFLLYVPSPLDATTVGQFYVRIEVNFGGTTPLYTDYIPLEVQS